MLEGRKTKFLDDEITLLSSRLTISTFLSLPPLSLSERSDAPCIRINVTWYVEAGQLPARYRYHRRFKGTPCRAIDICTRGALITNVTAIPPALEESLAEAERLISHRNRIINPERSGEASRFAIVGIPIPSYSVKQRVDDKG